MADVNDLMIDDGPAIYYDEGMRNVFEDHMNYLRTHPATTPTVFDPSKAYQYANDLFGLLQAYQVPAELHWIIMRMNQYTSPTVDFGEIPVLLIPDKTVVDHIRQSYEGNNRNT